MVGVPFANPSARSAASAALPSFVDSRMANVQWGAEGITTRVPWVLFAAIYPAEKEVGRGAVDTCVWALEGDASPDS